MHRTVALADRPEATSWPMVPSTAALGARRLGWLSSSPNTRYLPAHREQCPSVDESHTQDTGGKTLKSLTLWCLWQAAVTLRGWAAAAKVPSQIDANNASEVVP